MKISQLSLVSMISCTRWSLTGSISDVVSQEWILGHRLISYFYQEQRRKCHDIGLLHRSEILISYATVVIEIICRQLFHLLN
ncbi:unnamed protein product [Heterobilharzia americana]|nr:unnamed protein product [Heterobilharzia americana]